MDKIGRSLLSTRERWNASGLAMKICQELILGLDEALGIENVRNDPRFRADTNRVEIRDELIPILEHIFCEKPAIVV